MNINVSQFYCEAPRGTVSVSVLETDPVMRDEIVSRLTKSPVARLAHEYGSLEDCLNDIRQNPADIVIMDPFALSDPAVDAPQILDNKGISTIFFGCSKMHSMSLALSRRSVVGFVSREDGPAALCDMVDRFAEGIRKDGMRPIIAPGDGKVKLSRRERETLRGISRGLTAKQIAANLDISPKSVDTYRARACGKLGLNTRANVFEFVSAGHKDDAFADFFNSYSSASLAT